MGGFWKDHIKTTSAHGQDGAVISMLLPDGYYVEAGASDGYWGSNTLTLARLGWLGLLIEPIPEDAVSCRRHRPRATTLEVALAGQNGTAEFLVDVGNRQLSGLGGSQRGERKRRSIEVETVTLQEALDRADAPSVVDYLSLDTEGNELEVLDAYDWSRDISIMSVEHNFNRTNREAIRDLLEGRGYRLHTSLGVDDIFTNL